MSACKGDGRPVYRRRLQGITAASCLSESPMCPSVVARALPSYRNQDGPGTFQEGPKSARLPTASDGPGAHQDGRR
eukprot:4144538-Pyramimonas_sp.AAC.1